MTIAGGMLFWGRFLDPGSADWLSGLYTTYGVLCAVVSLASIALALQETIAAGHKARMDYARQVRRAHDEFSTRCGLKVERYR